VVIKLNIRAGRLKKKMNRYAASFTSSLEFDKRIFEADVDCNIAHCTMLAAEGIIEQEDADKIINSLDELKKAGIEALDLDPSVEDIHMAVESYVTQKIGDVAGFMHTAKSRNDQVATDLRLVLVREIEEIEHDILKFIDNILKMAEIHTETVMVGYTHLQHAQPTTFAHHLLAYANALKRDYERLKDAYNRVNMNPLGSAAMTTTSFNINRELTTELLGFHGLMKNSIDAVSSRDFAAETVFCLCMLASTLSKICEELINWSSYEFGILEISDEFSSTSSIMPQKKNPDVAEITRAKTAVLYGELMTVMTILKALPHSYNRDLQEITPHLWNAVDTSKSMVNIVNKMLFTIKIDKNRLKDLATSNFSTATELADVIVREKNVPFRVAHKIVGRMVMHALENDITPGEIGSKFLDKIAQDLIGENLDLKDEIIQKALDPYENILMRKTVGGPSPDTVKSAIAELNAFLDKEQS